MAGTVTPARKPGRRPVSDEVREDDILGPVLRCHGCGEEWPHDDEFFWRNSSGNLLGYCKACCVEYKRAWKVTRACA